MSFSSIFGVTKDVLFAFTTLIISRANNNHVVFVTPQARLFKGERCEAMGFYPTWISLQCIVRLCMRTKVVVTAEQLQAEQDAKQAAHGAAVAKELAAKAQAIAADEAERKKLNEEKSLFRHHYEKAQASTS
jgi:hypothetical protein